MSKSKAAQKSKTPSKVVEISDSDEQDEWEPDWWKQDVAALAPEPKPKPQIQKAEKAQKPKSAAEESEEELEEWEPNFWEEEVVPAAAAKETKGSKGSKESKGSKGSKESKQVKESKASNPVKKSKAAASASPLQESSSKKSKISKFEREQPKVHFEHQSGTSVLCGLHAVNHILQMQKLVWKTRSKELLLGSQDPRSTKSQLNAHALCKNFQPPKQVFEAYAEQAWVNATQMLMKRVPLDTEYAVYDYKKYWKWTFGHDIKFIPARDKQIVDTDVLISHMDAFKQRFLKSEGEVWLCDTKGFFPIYIFAKIAQTLNLDSKTMQASINYQEAQNLLLAPQCLGMIRNREGGLHWDAVVKYDRLTPPDMCRIYDSMEVAQDLPEAQTTATFFVDNPPKLDEQGLIFLFARDDSLECPAVDYWNEQGASKFPVEGLDMFDY